MPELTVKTQVRNLDRRLTQVEQILPALATRDDLARTIGGLRVEFKMDLGEVKGDLVEIKGDLVAVKADIVEIKADLVDVKADIVEIKADLVEVKTGLKDARRYALVLHEDVKADIRVVAEHLVGVMQRLDRR